MSGLVSACAAAEPPSATVSIAEAAAAAPETAPASAPFTEFDHSRIYGTLTTERFTIPAVDLRRIGPEFLRREVSWAREEEPGTIVVDTSARHAYFVLDGRKAIRYGIAVGRDQALNLDGEAFVERKAEWPTWRPTPSMLARDPARYAPFRHGMPGGVRNPLGARALYLYQDGMDTHYRLHGTVEPWTIGTNASAGCVRFINQDIIDLHRRVTLGTRVVILPAGVSVT